MVSIKRAIQRVGMRAFPDRYLMATSMRSRRLIERQARELGLSDLARRISEVTGGLVVAGPFAGMQLDYDALPVHSAPKFLGTYEREIFPYIESAIARNPKYVLNVGSSDGYYAVGFARRLPASIVFAADADPKSLRATMRNASLNKVADRVRTIGIVHNKKISKFMPSANSFLFMDCEGAEFQLLNPDLDDCLRHAIILVEIHHEFGDIRELKSRFRLTHSICSVDRQDRIAADSIIEIPGVDLLEALNERRGEQSWLYLCPKY